MLSRTLALMALAATATAPRVPYLGDGQKRAAIREARSAEFRQRFYADTPPIGQPSRQVRRREVFLATKAARRRAR